MINKDELLENFNMRYRKGLQEVQDKKKELRMKDSERTLRGGEMMYYEYKNVSAHIERLKKEIGEITLRNEGMDRAREIILDAERVEE